MSYDVDEEGWQYSFSFNHVLSKARVDRKKISAVKAVLNQASDEFNIFWR